MPLFKVQWFLLGYPAQHHGNLVWIFVG